MQKKRVPKLQMKNQKMGRDRTLKEFESKELGEVIKNARTAVVLRPQKPTSILIGEDLIAKLKRKAAKRGTAYQTMMKLIMRELIDEY